MASGLRVGPHKSKFASTPQTANDDFDMETVTAELLSLPILEQVNRDGAFTSASVADDGSIPMEVDTLLNPVKCTLCGDRASTSATYPNGMTTKVCDDLLCYSMAMHVEITKRSNDPVELEKFSKSIKQFSGGSTDDLGHLSPKMTNSDSPIEERDRAHTSLHNRGV